MLKTWNFEKDDFFAKNGGDEESISIPELRDFPVRLNRGKMKKKLFNDQFEVIYWQYS